MGLEAKLSGETFDGGGQFVSGGKEPHTTARHRDQAARDVLANRQEYFISDNVSFGRNIKREKREVVKGINIYSVARGPEGTMQTLKSQSVSRSSGGRTVEGSERTKELERRNSSDESGRDLKNGSGENQNNNNKNRKTDNRKKKKNRNKNNNCLSDFKRKNLDTSPKQVSEKDLGFDKWETLREQERTSKFDLTGNCNTQAPVSKPNAKNFHIQMFEKEESADKNKHSKPDKQNIKNEIKNKMNSIETDNLLKQDLISQPALLENQRISVPDPSDDIVLRIRDFKQSFPDPNHQKHAIKSSTNAKHISPQRKVRKNSGKHHIYSNLLQKPNNQNAKQTSGSKRLQKRNIWNEFSPKTGPRTKHQKSSYVSSKESLKSIKSKHSRVSWGSPKKSPLQQNRRRIQFEMNKNGSISNFSSGQNKTPSQSFRRSLKQRQSGDRDRPNLKTDLSKKVLDGSPYKAKISLYENYGAQALPKNQFKDFQPLNIGRFDKCLNLKELAQLSAREGVKLKNSNKLNKMTGGLQLDHRDFQNRFFYTERRNVQTDRKRNIQKAENRKNHSKAEELHRILDQQQSLSNDTSPRRLLKKNNDHKTPRHEGKFSNFKRSLRDKSKAGKGSQTAKLSLDLEGIDLKTRGKKKMLSIALKQEEKPRKVLLPYNFCSSRHYGSGAKARVKFPMLKEDSSQNLGVLAYASFKGRRRKFKGSPANFSQKTSKLPRKKFGDLSRGSRKDFQFARASFGNLENSLRNGVKMKKQGNEHKIISVGFQTRRQGRAFRKKDSVQEKFLEIKRESLNGSNRGEDFLKGQMSNLKNAALNSVQGYIQLYMFRYSNNIFFYRIFVWLGSFHMLDSRRF